jgi:hypothetical protein
MNKIIYAFITLASLTSCMSSYNIEGSSNVSTLDGRMLYLKVVKNGSVKNLDSCDVVHGQFRFDGTIDSVKMASLYMDNESVMPIVLEGGDITIKIDDTQQSCGGTPLNDKLFKFIDKYYQLESQVNELTHKQSQAIMDGKDMNVVNAKLSQEAQAIAQKEDHLVTSFITENFDNVLGPGVFMMITSGYQYPELTPWIEDIMSKATAKFKNDAYVKEYMSAAQRNQNIMNGMEAPANQPPATQQMPHEAPPTPNQMAQPTQQNDESTAPSQDTQM